MSERFAAESPYVAEWNAVRRLRHCDARSGVRYPVELPPEPAWYRRQTSRDIPMSRIGVLQGTYLGIYINPVCAFWNYSPPQNCRFCTTGANVGCRESAIKTVDDVVETCHAAVQESNVTFVHFNGGFQGSRGLRETEPYVRAVKENVGALVGVQLTPEKDFSAYDRLIDLGVDHFSFCFELFDPEWFARICPGKAKMLGQDLFFDAMDYCASQHAARRGLGRDHRRHRAHREHDRRDRTDHVGRRVSHRLRLPAHRRLRHGGLAAAGLSTTCAGAGRGLRRLPAASRADRPRAKHRGQPRREPG